MEKLQDAGRNDFWQVLMYRGWFYEMVEERAAVDFRDCQEFCVFSLAHHILL